MLPEKAVTKWVERPRRVPGSRHDARSASSRPVAATIVTPGGALRRPTATTTAASRPTPAAMSKVGVHPAACSPATSGNAATIWPACPSSPVSWVTSGARPAGNQAGISRSTLMNVIASPAPTSTRAASPSDRLLAVAISSWPPDMNTAPTTIMRREPTRSSTTPTGTCIPAYTASWTTPSRESTPALMPKRCWASRPATPSEARWKTATVYAKTPSPHITQARRATVSTTRHNTLCCRGHPRAAPHEPSPAYVDRASPQHRFATSYQAAGRRPPAGGSEPAAADRFHPGLEPAGGAEPQQDVRHVTAIGPVGDAELPRRRLVLDAAAHQHENRPVELRGGGRGGGEGLLERLRADPERLEQHHEVRGDRRLPDDQRGRAGPERIDGQERHRAVVDHQAVRQRVRDPNVRSPLPHHVHVVAHGVVRELLPGVDEPQRHPAVEHGDVMHRGLVQQLLRDGATGQDTQHLLVAASGQLLQHFEDELPTVDPARLAYGRGPGIAAADQPRQLGPRLQQLPFPAGQLGLLQGQQRIQGDVRIDRGVDPPGRAFGDEGQLDEPFQRLVDVRPGNVELSGQLVEVGVGVGQHRAIDGLRQTVKAEDLQRHRLPLSARVRRDPIRPGEPGQRSTTRVTATPPRPATSRSGPAGRGHARPYPATTHRPGAWAPAGGPAPRHRTPDRDGDSARWNPSRDDSRASARPRQGSRHPLTSPGRCGDAKTGRVTLQLTEPMSGTGHRPPKIGAYARSVTLIARGTARPWMA